MPYRKAGNTLKPTVTIIIVRGRCHHMNLDSAFKNTEFTEFKLGEECDEVTANGRKVKSTITMDGSTMKHVQVGEKTTYIERIIEGDKMLTTATVEDLVSKQEYTKCRTVQKVTARIYLLNLCIFHCFPYTLFYLLLRHQ
uniref:Lipocln_cytosolic_FA-bd_dom domain-containing protein n=1 Tax=Mesocestoides corti TaxID=53468 RepID=A0A5K3FKB7_MESCO